jgi:hypothetical protein
MSAGVANFSSPRKIVVSLSRIGDKERFRDGAGKNRLDSEKPTETVENGGKY